MHSQGFKHRVEYTATSKEQNKVGKGSGGGGSLFIYPSTVRIIYKKKEEEILFHIKKLIRNCRQNS